MTLGEAGIMQQIGLDGINPLLAELEHMAGRSPADYRPVHELVSKMWEKRQLGGRELERLRELMEFYHVRRPTGVVMEVRDAKRKRGSFWPNHHADGVWFHHPEGIIGGDENGVFFRDSKSQEYFRSTRFRQTRLERSRYLLEDVATGGKSESKIAVCDCWYEERDDDRPPQFLSSLLGEVVFSCYHFKDAVGKLVLQLQTMAKLGVIIGQPILVAENEFAELEEEETLPG